MVDTYTGDLLATAEDALCPPPDFSPQQLGEWHSHTLRNRLPLIREALRMAREEGDTELAVQLIDQAISDYPAPRAPLPRSLKVIGGDGARLTLPPQARNSADDELPVPEHILCGLLYRHWAMTVEGKPPHERYVAHRPIGWAGEGDPFERLTAPTRTELLRLLAHRHLGIGRNTPVPGSNNTHASAEGGQHRPQGKLVRLRGDEERRREQETTGEESS